MPVTKTAKRALRSSTKKTETNAKILALLDMAIRKARRDKKEETMRVAFSLADRAAKKHVLHTKKADRIKSRLSKRVATS